MTRGSILIWREMVILLALSTVGILEKVVHVLMALHMGPQSSDPTDFLFIGVSVIASEMR